MNVRDEVFFFFFVSYDQRVNAFSCTRGIYRNKFETKIAVSVVIRKINQFRLTRNRNGSRETFLSRYNFRFMSLNDTALSCTPIVQDVSKSKLYLFIHFFFSIEAKLLKYTMRY